MIRFVSPVAELGLSWDDARSPDLDPVPVTRDDANSAKGETARRSSSEVEEGPTDRSTAVAERTHAAASSIWVAAYEISAVVIIINICASNLSKWLLGLWWGLFASVLIAPKEESNH